MASDTAQPVSQPGTAVTAAPDERPAPHDVRLCRRVRPIAVPLVDAFAIPPAVLRSPDLLG